ncbi:MAG: IS200/IS605 family transposase [Cyclobacteriaceae bacterium]
MANTFTQLHIQFVFAVQNRISLIQPLWEEELFKYITGIVKNHKHKMIAINGMPDHAHLFIGLHPTQSISSLMQIVKGESSEWINKKGFANGKFQWQEGYGAFSYGHSQVSQVYNYVMNQKEHHRKRSFLDEYRELLKKFEVPFEDQYIFHPLE